MPREGKMKTALPLSLAVSLVIVLQPIVFGRSALDDGVMLYQKHQYQAAKRQFLKATAADPTSAAAQYHLANSYVHLGDHALAQKHYRLASLLDPTGNYGRFAVQALSGYSGKEVRPAELTGDQQYLPESRFAVARITDHDQSKPIEEKRYPIPKQFPQVSGYDAERSYLYQHGIYQAYGGPVNTQLPAHTTTKHSGWQYNSLGYSQYSPASSGGHNPWGTYGMQQGWGNQQSEHEQLEQHQLQEHRYSGH